MPVRMYDIPPAARQFFSSPSTNVLPSYCFLVVSLTEIMLLKKFPAMFMSSASDELFQHLDGHLGNIGDSGESNKVSFHLLRYWEDEFMSWNIEYKI